MSVDAEVIFNMNGWKMCNIDTFSGPFIWSHVFNFLYHWHMLWELVHVNLHNKLSRLTCFLAQVLSCIKFPALNRM